MKPTIDLDMSRELLDDLLALLNMYKATNGMIKQFHAHSTEAEQKQWQETKTEYENTIKAYFKNSKEYMIADDAMTFLAQAKGHINLGIFEAETGA